MVILPPAFSRISRSLSVTPRCKPHGSSHAGRYVSPHCCSWHDGRQSSAPGFHTIGETIAGKETGGADFMVTSPEISLVPCGGRHDEGKCVFGFQHGIFYMVGNQCRIARAPGSRIDGKKDVGVPTGPPPPPALMISSTTKFRKIWLGSLEYTQAIA